MSDAYNVRRNNWSFWSPGVLSIFQPLILKETFLVRICAVFCALPFAVFRCASIVYWNLVMARFSNVKFMSDRKRWRGEQIDSPLSRIYTTFIVIGNAEHDKKFLQCCSQYLYSFMRTRLPAGHLHFKKLTIANFVRSNYSSAVRLNSFYVFSSVKHSQNYVKL